MADKHKALWASYRVNGAYYYREWAGFKEFAELFLRNHRSTPPLVLKRDPTNRHDSNAIAVYTPNGLTQIGWVPKVSNSQLALVMDTYGPRIVAELEPQSDFKTCQLFMSIYLIKDSKSYVIDPPEAVPLQGDCEIESYFPIPPAKIKASPDQAWTLIPEGKPVAKPKMDDFL